MSASTTDSSTQLVEDIDSIFNIGALSSVWMTRRIDHVSVLLHEIEFNIAQALKGDGVDTPLPDFSAPFVTRILGPARIDGRFYLVEPLPPCLGLHDIWQSTLAKDPKQAPAVLRCLLRQVRQAAQMEGMRNGQHGAISKHTVVLTTVGVYGLLQARIGCVPDTVWVRPQEVISSDPLAFQETDDDIAINRMAVVLVESALAHRHIPDEVRAELRSMAAAVQVT